MRASSNRDFDPWQAEQAFVWKNRLALARSAPAEPIFHALSYFALALALAIMSAGPLRENATAIRVFLLEWQWPVLLAVLLLCASWQIRSLRKTAAERVEGWLSSQPIGQDVRLRSFRRRALWLCAAQLVLLLASGLALRLPAMYLLVASGCALTASLLVATNPDLLVRGSGLGAGQAVSIAAAKGRGQVWQWQLLEARGVAGPKRISSLMVLMLLIPANGRALVIAVCVLAALTIALLAGAWQRSLQVLPEAQRWLATQPINSGTLLGAWLLVPVVIAGLSMLAVAVACSGLGVAPVLTILVVVVVAAMAGLGIACTAVERRRPRRASMLFAANVVFLAAMFQAFPPAVPVAWVAQMALLWRRALKT